jgi:hypothetical protein
MHVPSFVMNSCSGEQGSLSCEGKERLCQTVCVTISLKRKWMLPMRFSTHAANHSQGVKKTTCFFARSAPENAGDVAAPGSSPTGSNVGSM